MSAVRTGQATPTVAKLRTHLRHKSVRRRLARTTFVVTNIAILALVVFFVFGGRSGTGSSQAILPAKNKDATAATNPLDQLSSADIALTVSRMANMPEVTAVTNQADSADVSVATASSSNSVTSKPEVVASSFKSNKDIQDYAVQNGDTVSSVAAKFNVTSDSIKWSNGLSSDTVAAGTKLAIPPVGYSGIVYTVKSGDTLDTIAAKYKADKNELTAANDAEISGLQVGERIIIPNGQQPVVAHASISYSSGFAWGGAAIYSGNGYDYGYCTYWVAQRRIQVGNPLPSNLGNASSWPYTARSAGMAEGNTPKVNAAAVTSTRGEGHVVFVEAVNDDGSIVISEMNHLGWAVKDTQTISADVASQYIYIY